VSRTRALAPLLSISLLAACHAVGPDYERPLVQLPHKPETATVASGAITTTTAQPWARWWEVFHDAELERLVRQALGDNFDLRAALARVETERAIVREQFAPILPYVSTYGAWNYIRIPPNLTGATQPSAGQVPVAFSGNPFQTWIGLGTLSWELDVWGKARRQLESANAEEIATEEDRKALETSLIADVASAYFDVGEGDAELAILHEAVATREETLSIVQKRVETGFATELELRRAEGDLAAARAQVPEAEIRKALAEHRLAILIGREPDLHFLGRAPAEFELPPEIPIGVPATLLERRPDVRAAEARVASQNAKIGVAIANFFPQFTVFGAAGYASLDIWKIAQPASQLYVVNSAVRLPLFTGGLTYAQMLEAEARTDEATANYHAVVLRAFGEVADSVVRIALDQGVRDEQTTQVTAARRAFEVATVQYEQGLALFLDVLSAQRDLLAARQLLLRTQRQILADIVTLEKALGGGWRELKPDEFQRKLVEPFMPPEDEKLKPPAEREATPR
jgi:NodT family efflux transporter outer membrane factor (OMF) lipoprotein